MIASFPPSGGDPLVAKIVELERREVRYNEIARAGASEGELELHDETYNRPAFEALYKSPVAPTTKAGAIFALEYIREQNEFHFAVAGTELLLDQIIAFLKREAQQ